MMDAGRPIVSMLEARAGPARVAACWEQVPHGPSDHRGGLKRTRRPYSGREASLACDPGVTLRE
jgi:hypothetical protein